MKDYDAANLEDGRPSLSGLDAVSYCLDRLYADRRHKLTDRLAPQLTYEELIGALLLARDRFEEDDRVLEEQN